MSEFSTRRRPKAKRPHKCNECRRQIAAGEVYERQSGKSDGYLYDIALCLPCADIWHEAGEAFDWYGEDAPACGDLRSELQEHHGITDASAWAASRREMRAKRKWHAAQPPWLADDLAAYLDARSRP